jgi:hypothetical protein
VAGDSHHFDTDDDNVDDDDDDDAYWYGYRSDDDDDDAFHRIEGKRGWCWSSVVILMMPIPGILYKGSGADDGHQCDDDDDAYPWYTV